MLYYTNFNEKDLLLIREQNILQGFREGRQQTFKQLFSTIMPGLFSFVVRRITLYRLQQIVEPDDIVINSFLKLFQARQRFHEIDHAVAFLYTTAKNELIDIQRNQKIKREYITYELQREEEFEVNDIQNEQEEFKKELIAKIRNAIQRLPKQRRAVIEMYFYEGRSTNEIANLLKLNSQTVLNHKTRGILQIKDYIHGNELDTKKQILCLNTNQVFKNVTQASVSVGLRPITIKNILKGYTENPKMMFKYID